MEGEHGADDDRPFFPWLPPEDRLWRHPSESTGGAGSTGGTGGQSSPEPRHPPRGLRAVRIRAVENLSLRNAWVLVLLAGAVGALTASVIGIASGAWSQRTTVVDPVIGSSPSASVAAAVAGTGLWTQVENDVAPSIVEVEVTAATGEVYGSGVMLFNDGAGSAYLVTDRSLFASGTGPIEITAPSGIKARATLLGQDTDSDIAVLAVSNRVPWIFAPIGSVADVVEASQVIAMAAPSFGSAAAGATVAPGTVSSTDSEVTLVNGGDLDHLMLLTTPTMANTGGPAVDQDGQVVGITVKLTPVNNMGLTFAVPIDEVEQAARAIVAGRSAVHPWLGLTQTLDVPSAVAEQKGISGGASVYGVAPNSPASRLGIVPSDIILSLDDKQVDSSGALEAALDRSPMGRAVPITFLHQGRIVSTWVSLTTEPPGS